MYDFSVALFRIGNDVSLHMSITSAASPVSIQTQSLTLATMIGGLPTQALVFLAVFVYATHATQAIAFEWKPGVIVTVQPHTARHSRLEKSYAVDTFRFVILISDRFQIYLQPISQF